MPICLSFAILSVRASSDSTEVFFGREDGLWGRSGTDGSIGWNGVDEALNSASSFFSKSAACSVVIPGLVSEVVPDDNGAGRLAGERERV